MKRFALAFAFFCMTLVPAQAQGWGLLKNSGMETKEPEAAYQVEAAGVNFRVYEWTPETDPSKTCVAMFSEAGPSMQCMDKPIAQE